MKSDVRNAPNFAAFDASCEPREVLSELNVPDDGDFEGVVLRFSWPKTGPYFRVKVKTAEYRRLHKLITGTSTKTVWEALSTGSDMEALTGRVPDEFHMWLKTTVASFHEAYRETDARVRATYEEVCATVGTGADRKAFAMEAVRHRDKAYLFHLLDGKPIDEMIWKSLKPEYARPFRHQSEDVA